MEKERTQKHSVEIVVPLGGQPNVNSRMHSGRGWQIMSDIFLQVCYIYYFNMLKLLEHQKKLCQVYVITRLSCFLFYFMWCSSRVLQTLNLFISFWTIRYVLHYFSITMKTGRKLWAHFTLLLSLKAQGQMYIGRAVGSILRIVLSVSCTCIILFTLNVGRGCEYDKITGWSWSLE